VGGNDLGGIWEDRTKGGNTTGDSFRGKNAKVLFRQSFYGKRSIYLIPASKRKNQAKRGEGTYHNNARAKNTLNLASKKNRNNTQSNLWRGGGRVMGKPAARQTEVKGRASPLLKKQHGARTASSRQKGEVAAGNRHAKGSRR